ncbi:SpaA isopeptide-forming pilin-related protein [Leucobacter chinensis]|uniref:SpaA isopeptide-forming pilin-related protein n=1 Tax=Leucobacter chinensis TaxID=2851010 RepID=UPI001C2364D1
MKQTLGLRLQGRFGRGWAGFVAGILTILLLVPVFADSTAFAVEPESAHVETESLEAETVDEGQSEAMASPEDEPDVEEGVAKPEEADADKVPLEEPEHDSLPELQNEEPVEQVFELRATTTPLPETTQLQQYVGIATGTSNPSINTQSNNYLGRNAQAKSATGAAPTFTGIDWSGNLTSIQTAGKSWSSDATEVYAERGYVSRASNPNNNVSSSTKYYPGGSKAGNTFSSTSGRGYVQDVAAMNTLQSELAGMRSSMCNAETEATGVLPNGDIKGMRTINVDQYDINGDGIAIIEVGKKGTDSQLDGATLIIEGSGNVLPVFRVADGIHFKANNSSVLLGTTLGQALSTRTSPDDGSPNEAGAVFVKCNSGGKNFDFSNAHVNGIAFWDLTSGNSPAMQLSNVTGCGQFVAPKHEWSNVELTRCAIGVASSEAQTTKIIVRVSGDRTPGQEGAGTPVEGVQLRLAPQKVGNSVDQWANYDWATCTSNAAGDCVFEVPLKSSGITDASGMASNQRPWVVGVSAPEGWSMFEAWTNGNRIGNEYVYGFQVDASLSGGQVIRSNDPTNTDFMRTTRTADYASREDKDQSSSNYDQNFGWPSFGQWAVLRDNPVADQMCGADVAILMDLSSSIGSALPKAKAALDVTVDAYVGTPSNLALFTFSQKSPSTGSSSSQKTQNYPELRAVRTSSQANQFKQLYKSWTLGSGTNWDAGLHAVATAEQQYDTLIVITDGDPTAYGTPGFEGTSVSNPRLKDVEAAIFSANLLKGKGTRIVNFMVGDYVKPSSHNLNVPLISGPVQNEDWFVSSNYDQAAQQLAKFAKNSCQGTVEVTKRVVDAQRYSVGMTQTQLDAISEPAAGWELSATPTAPLTIPAGAEEQETKHNGKALFPVKFTDPATSGDITIRETQKDGYSIVPVNGKNLACVEANDGVQISVTDVVSQSSPGATFTARDGVAIECTLYNLEEQTDPMNGEVSWKKTGEHASSSEDVDLLAGSEWLLEGPNGYEQVVLDCVTATAEECENAIDNDHREGHFNIKQLAWGDYTLTETKAPAGYIKLDESLEFTLDEDNLVIDLGNIPNKQQPPLTIPLTGGIGTFWFMLIGGGLLGILLVAASHRMRQRRTSLNAI